MSSAYLSGPEAFVAFCPQLISPVLSGYAYDVLLPLGFAGPDYSLSFGGGTNAQIPAALTVSGVVSSLPFDLVVGADWEDTCHRLGVPHTFETLVFSDDDLLAISHGIPFHFAPTVCGSGGPEDTSPVREKCSSRDFVREIFTSRFHHGVRTSAFYSSASELDSAMILHGMKPHGVQTDRQKRSLYINHFLSGAYLSHRHHAPRASSERD